MNSLRQWKQLELYSEYPRQTASRDTSSEEFIASRLSESPAGQIRLMESILERNNMNRAVKRVIKNKGAPGVDGMTVRNPKSTAQWDILAHACKTEGNSKARRRNPPVRDTNCAGQGNTAGCDTGLDSDLGPYLLRNEFRIPA